MSAFSLTIGGKPVITRNTFAVVNPADESIVAQCPLGTVELVDQAVSHARAALAEWSARSDSDRAAKLSAIADLISKAALSYAASRSE